MWATAGAIAVGLKPSCFCWLLRLRQPPWVLVLVGWVGRVGPSVRFELGGRGHHDGDGWRYRLLALSPVCPADGCGAASMAQAALGVVGGAHLCGWGGGSRAALRAGCEGDGWRYAEGLKPGPLRTLRMGPPAGCCALGWLHGRAVFMMAVALPPPRGGRVVAGALRRLAPMGLVCLLQWLGGRGVLARRRRTLRFASARWCLWVASSFSLPSRPSQGSTGCV